MNLLSKISVVSVAALALAACDSDNNNSNQDIPEAETFQVQVLHASPDAPLVNVSLNNQQVLTNVDYKQGSGRFTLEAGSYPVAIDAILPGQTPTVIGEDLAFEGGNIYTIAAINTVDALEPLVIAQPDTPVSAGSARLLVVHATPGAAPEFSLPVDVYVDAYSEPNAPIGTSAPIRFDYKEVLADGPIELAAGDYQVRVTLPDGTPVYDSGRLPLADGNDLVVAAVPNVSGGPAALTLVALTGQGSAQFLDVNTPTGLRVGHLSPDTPAVDILVNAGEYLGDVEFTAVTPVVALPTDTYEVAITVANNPGGIAFGPAELTLEAGIWSSVFATDVNANLNVVILDEDDPRPVALFPKVRIYHASPTAADVDIYLVGEGGAIDGVTPALTNIPFGANTGYLALSAGTFDVVVTPTGTTTEAIRETITIEDGGVYTAIARDPVEGEFGLIVQEDVLVD
jgi:hypothetical protein